MTEAEKLFFKTVNEMFGAQDLQTFVHGLATLSVMRHAQKGHRDAETIQDLSKLDVASVIGLVAAEALREDEQ